MRPFLSSSRNSEGRFFPLFPKIVKNRWKKGLNDEVRLERFWKRLWDRSWPFNILESVEKFLCPCENRLCPFEIPFAPLSEPVCAPLETRSCPLFFLFKVFLLLLSYHIYICATSSPTIGPRRTTITPRTSGRFAFVGEGPIWSNMHNMFAATHSESKRNDSVRKARA